MSGLSNTPPPIKPCSTSRQHPPGQKVASSSPLLNKWPAVAPLLNKWPAPPWAEKSKLPGPTVFSSLGKSKTSGQQPPPSRTTKQVVSTSTLLCHPPGQQVDSPPLGPRSLKCQGQFFVCQASLKPFSSIYTEKSIFGGLIF